MPIILRPVPAGTDPGDVRLYDPAQTDTGGSISAAVAVTEADDTLSSAATLALAGAEAGTEDNDTLAATGALGIAAAVSVVEADDTTVEAAALALAAALAVLQANDTLSAIGALDIRAESASTEADDTLAATGSSEVTTLGAVAVTEADDTLSATATIASAATGTGPAPGFHRGGSGEEWWYDQQRKQVEKIMQDALEGAGPAKVARDGAGKEAAAPDRVSSVAASKVPAVGGDEPAAGAIADGLDPEDEIEIELLLMALA